MEAYRNFQEASTFCINDCLISLTNNTITLDVVINRLESIVLAAEEHLDSGISEVRSAVNIIEEVIFFLSNEVINREAVSQGPGRPPIKIDINGIEALLSMGFKGTKIAEIYGISSRTLHRRLNDHGISVRLSYSTISEEQLTLTVTDILMNFPNTGYKRMRGFLLARNIKIPELRVREIMREVDPEGVYYRTRQNRAIVRRQYFVRYSNQMWHLDTNLKLIRWKIVIRGALDGKSRTCLYLEAGGNNTSQGNFESFLNGVRKYGIPYRCRSDKGDENVLVAQYMLETRGFGRASHICGRSVHNQRIERFWRDLGYGLISFYRSVFLKLEEDRWLNVENPKHMHAFHHIFLPRINHHLQTFMDAWNQHPLSTETNMTPQQIMLSNLPPPFFDLMMTEDAEISAEFIINSQEDLQLFDEEDSLINPSPMVNVLSEEEVALLYQINPLDESDSYGCDMFIRAVQCLNL